MPNTEDVSDAVAELFDEYTTAVLDGQCPNRDEYLDRCPADEHDRMIDAMQGFAWARSFYAHRVSDETTQKTMRALEAIRRRKQGGGKGG